MDEKAAPFFKAGAAARPNSIAGAGAAAAFMARAVQQHAQHDAVLSARTFTPISHAEC